LNPGGLRHPDELVRHKVLDALGDFKLSGYAIQGYFRLHRSGHDVHSQLLKAIFAQPENYEIIGHSAGSTSAGTQSVGSSAGRVGVGSTGRLAAAF
jgi:UDP-3-O-[3-hydroxymyristoyl] N-acetylglucosamine deacetylase